MKCNNCEMQREHIDEEGYCQDCASAYNQGIRDALEYLSDLYDGITETDLWSSYMTNEEAI